MAVRNLAGMRLLVTGASEGIGRAIAKEAVNRGCRVLAVARKQPDLDALAAEVIAEGGKLEVLAGDITRGDDGSVRTTPEVIDVYELRATTAGIELRKSHTTRWIELGSLTVAASCTVAGGTWDGAMCGCVSGRSFVPGAGGCIEVPGANESKCDASTGLWTDDDATLIGSYCNCGSGRRVDRDGACAAI